jgi:hypothetical protein
MTQFTDFKAGLQNVNDYLDAKHHITGTVAGGADALRIVGSAQYSFTLRELLCGVLSGNGIKLPNIQICLYANIQALLGIPNLQAELFDALSQLEGAMQDFMNHTNIDSILGRLNGILSEAQNVANLINFCGRPIDPIAIPNMLENAFGSFLGAGKDLIDQIGSIAPENVCACIGTGGFNSNVFNGGILGNIANNIGAINAGSLGQSVIDSIRADIEGVTGGISNLISKENNIRGAYSQGGSQFATPDSGCNSEVGVLHNPITSAVSDNARITSSLKALYDNLAGYPVRYQRAGSSSLPNNGQPTAGQDTTYIEYPNIFHVLLEPEFIELLNRADNPNPNITNQIPVYDYCGSIIGYTTQFVQGSDETSQGTAPTVPNSPGYLAGGLSTSQNSVSTTDTIAGGTVSISGGGNTVYFVSSLDAQLALQANTNDIIVRTDILTIFIRKSTVDFNTGTIQDYQQSSVTFSFFGNSVNDLQGEGFVVKSGNTAIVRQILGTTNQIEVDNNAGQGGNVVIRLSDNTRIPGTGAIKIPSGTTAQRPTPESGKIRYNTDNDHLEAYFNDSGLWESLVTANDLTQNTTALLNIGTGVEVFKQLNVSNQNEIRRVNRTGLITLAQNANDITIGDSLTVTNTGTGIGVFRQRNVNNLEYKSLTSSNNIVLTDNGDSINISSSSNETFLNLTTTDDTTTVLNLPTIPINKSWFFEMYVIARAGTTNRAWKLEGVVQDSSGTQSIVGSVIKSDYQRNTSDIASLNPWDPMYAYSANDSVEYNLVEYTANVNVQSIQNPAADTTNWSATYIGWNVSVVVNGSNQIEVRVKGEPSLSVNWSVKHVYIQV